MTKRSAARRLEPAPSEREQAATFAEIVEQIVDSLSAPLSKLEIHFPRDKIVTTELLRAIEGALRNEYKPERPPHSPNVIILPLEGFPRFAIKLRGLLKPQQITPLMLEIERKLRERYQLKSATTPAPSRGIEHPKAQTHERRMVDEGKYPPFIQEGIRYFPLSAAAPVIQVPRSTLMHWINKETKFDGRPLQTFYFAPANRYFISEESIDRAANRFIKWPSQEPAGPVTLGEQRDQKGYIGLTDAARTLGVDHHTMWRWTTKGTAPIEKPLDVIKCPASDQFYIRQKDVAALKKLVPRSGLHSGRRRQSALQPS